MFELAAATISQLFLCGQRPEVVMQTALTAMTCYTQQAELMAEARVAKDMFERMQALKQQVRKCMVWVVRTAHSVTE
jgi:TRAP-type C4-dicarboxylate transport system permease large subunit